MSRIPFAVLVFLLAFMAYVAAAVVLADHVLVLHWTVQALSSDIQAVTAQYWLGGANPWDGHETYWKQSPLSFGEID